MSATSASPSMNESPAPDLSPPADAPAGVVNDRRGHWPIPVRSLASTLLIAGLATVAALAILRAWQLGPFAGTVQVTDNAYVHGRTTVVAPQVGGYVVDVAARDFANVAAGDLLARIDDRIYRAQVEQASATLDVQLANLANIDQAHASKLAALRGQLAAVQCAKAQLTRARSDLARADELIGDGSISKREQDQLRAALAQAEAQLSQADAAQDIARQDVRTVEVNRNAAIAQIEVARAALRRTQIDLGYAAVRAPQAGQLGEVGVRVGQYVSAGTQLLALVPADRWVIANFKEAQTARMAPGQKAWITVDALGDRRIEGHVEQVAPAAGSEFSVIKPDNGTGNFVKIPQRIGVRIALDGPAPAIAALRPGMSVEVSVETKHAP